jgi:hypothetical protein
MKVLYVGLARTLWLFDFSLMNPKGMSLQPLIDNLRERYMFAVSPKNPLDFGDSKALTFKSGTFVNSKGVPVIVGLQIYNDGFVVDTLSSTNDSTECLEKTTDWMGDQFGLKLPPNVRKGFVSNIDFESDASLMALNPRLPQFFKSLEKYFKPIVEAKQRHFQLTSLGSWTEDMNQPLAPAAFKIERKIGPPFSSNHYFSQAPLETDPHIQLLNEFEQMLKV